MRGRRTFYAFISYRRFSIDFFPLYRPQFFFLLLTVLLRIDERGSLELDAQLDDLFNPFPFHAAFNYNCFAKHCIIRKQEINNATGE